MALSNAGALDAVRNLMNGARSTELPRLNRISAALRPWSTSTCQVEVPNDAPAVMKRLAAKSETNFLPLVAETFSQVMKVDGYYSSGSPERSAAWDYWQRNRMDARQTGIHRSALHYGAAYATVLPGDNGPVIRGMSPRRMTAVYEDPEFDEWPMLALDVDRNLLKLYDDECVYYVGAENLPRGTFEDFSGFWDLTGATFKFIERRTHDVGVTPVVRYRDRMLLDGEEQFGIIEPLLTIQSRINETTFGMLVAQFFAAFKQRYVIGWIPKSESEAMRAGASETWYFADSKQDIDVGQFSETDLTRYISSKSSALRDLAAIGQVPAQNLGIDGVANISAETLAALEAGKERKADEITTSLGESHEQMLRLCSHIEGDSVSAEDYGSEVRWKDATARSFAQTVDGLGKLATMLGVPQEVLWEQIPGWSDKMIERAKAAREAADSLAQLNGFLSSQAASVDGTGSGVPASG